jgi:glycosyltransferase involved in cell wall biosynthesis
MKTAEDQKPDVIKVLHPITRLIVGGAQENTMYTGALLDKARFMVEILSGPQTGSEGSLIEEVRGWQVPLIILPELVREIKPQKDFIALFKLYRLIKKNRYTIVHTHSSKAGILGRLAAKLAGVPIIVHTVHGWSFHDYMNPLVRTVYVFLERYAAWLCDALIVVSERDQIKGLHEAIGEKEKYHLIRSAVPVSDFDPSAENPAGIRRELGIPADSLVLGNVGRFSPQKNPLDWVRVAAKVAEAIPECHFLLVGDGPLRPQVEKMILRENLAKRVTLPGLRRDVSRLMSAMDVFLMTSLWEGLPRVIPQAMSMEIPVVANRVDGTVEVVNHGYTGYLCEPGDIQKMAEYCLELLKDPTLRQKIGQNGRAAALREFDLENMISKIESLYDQLLSTHCSEMPV